MLESTMRAPRTGLTRARLSRIMIGVMGDGRRRPQAVGGRKPEAGRSIRTAGVGERNGGPPAAGRPGLSLDEQAKRASSQLQALIARTRDSLHASPPSIDDLLGGWQHTLEELHLASEELSTQSEELIESRVALAAERQRYRDLFDLAPDGYLVTDREELVLEANQAASTMLEVPQPSLHGKPMVLYVDRTERPAFFALLEGLARGAPRRTWQTRLRARRRGAYAAALTVSPIASATGEVAGARWLLRDISAQHEVEAALRESQAALAASREQLRALSGRLLAASEEERRRISRELHDDISQRVAALGLEVRALRGRPLDRRSRGLLRELDAHLGELAEDLRRLTRDLHPRILEDLGLTAALQAHGEQLAKRERLRVTVREREGHGSIAADVALCLYRVAQEALRNVRKHAGARRATVILARTRCGGVGLCVRDRGRGFDVAAVTGQVAGLGLVSMAERLRLVGGHLMIRSRPGRGTHVHALVRPGTARP
jgi:PAS domain S-box-containing protein